MRAMGIVLGAATVLLAGQANAACAPKAATEPEVVAAPLRAMYAAAKADDVAGFAAATTPDFRAFDAGRQFTGPELMAMIKTAHAAGKRYEWTVPDPKVETACNVALVTYVNRGWVEDASGRQPLTWLESATVRYADGRWRIAFFHSTRAAPAP